MENKSQDASFPYSLEGSKKKTQHWRRHWSHDLSHSSKDTWWQSCGSFENASCYPRPSVALLLQVRSENQQHWHHLEHLVWKLQDPTTYQAQNLWEMMPTRVPCLRIQGSQVQSRASPMTELSAALISCSVSHENKQMKLQKNKIARRVSQIYEYLRSPASTL